MAHVLHGGARRSEALATYVAATPRKSVTLRRMPGKVMANLHPDLKAILIGGSSHVGKSAVSESLAAKLAWAHISTDTLARHPGRPWNPAPEKVPDRVAEHYLCLSIDELIEDVLRHYRTNVWPKVKAIIALHSNNASTAGVVLEGSALWPEFVASLYFDDITALWLTASEEIFRRRIHDGRPLSLEVSQGTDDDRQVPRAHSCLQRPDG